VDEELFDDCDDIEEELVVVEVETTVVAATMAARTGRSNILGRGVMMPWNERTRSKGNIIRDTDNRQKRVNESCPSSPSVYLGAACLPQGRGV
jgi:hypothetical protein